MSTVTYVISFSTNGGSGSVPSTISSSGTAPVTVSLPSSPVPSKSYYYFNGWSTSSSATSGGYSATIKTSGAYTMYAAWAHSTAYVYFKANGGSGAPSTITHWAGYSVTLPTTEPTRTGYIFLGWATSASATTAQYQPSTTYNLFTTVTLYAVWKVAADKLSTDDGTMGTAMTLTITKYDSSYTDTITYSFGDTTGTIATDTTETSISWTPPTTLASEIPNASSGTLKFTVKTYEDGTLLGTSTTSVTLSVPDSLAPTASVSFADTIATPLSWGLYVQSRSKLAFTITASAQESATIASYATSVNGTTYSGASFTTDVLLYSGSNSYSTVVTDSRGLQTTVTGTFTVVTYSNPSATLVSCDRDDSDAETVNIEFDFNVASVSSNNDAYYAIDYKTMSSSSWTSGTETALGSYSGTITDTLTGIDEGDEYDIRIRVIDSFTTASITTEVGVSGNILLNSRHEGGLGLLMKSQADDQLDIGKPTLFHEYTDSLQRRCYATVASGWRRVLTYTADDSSDLTGSQGLTIRFNIQKNTSENHSITMRCIANSITFTGESSVSTSLTISKIRYTYNSTLLEGYVDIYSTGSGAVGVCYDVYGAYEATQGKVNANSLESVDDAPSGETILATHTFTGSGYVPNQSIVTDYGDLSQTGSRIFLAGDSTSIETSTWTTVATCELTEGIWIVLCTARFSSNATGRRNMIVSTSQDTSSDSVSANFANIVAPVTGALTYLKSFDIQVIAEGETKTLYINLWQNSGSTLTSNGRFYAIRIA